VEAEDGEVRGEAGGFGFPVAEEGFGADDETGLVREARAESGDEGERLEGFAETHFVGEDAAETGGGLIEEPLDPGFLVIAEDIEDGSGDRVCGGP